MAYQRRIGAHGMLMGLHSINDRRSVREVGSMEIVGNRPLLFDRNPLRFQGDPYAVNVYAGPGATDEQQWDHMHFGHINTIYVEPHDCAHYISALMDGDDRRLPPALHGLAHRVRVEGMTLEKTTHRPTGSHIAIFFLFDVNEEAAVVDAAEQFLVTSGMVVTRL